MDGWLMLFSVFALLASINGFDDVHKEELYIRPIESGHVYSYFQFTTLWNASYDNTGSFSHYHLFPKSLGEVLEAWGVEELHLSQTQGLWHWDKWGYPVQAAPPGAELWVWFHKSTHDVDKAWKNLINVLSGMFCASLNFLDASNSISPKWSFRPEGATSHGGFKGFVRYATLPRENVCTENLTPWKKLLPCGSQSGLGSLFNAHKLYDASYHSLGLHFRSVCRENSTEECSETSVELKQTLSVVFEPTLSFGHQDWTFKKVFGRMISNVCPLAESSKIYVDLSQNKTAVYFFKLTPEPTSVDVFWTKDGRKSKVAAYDLSQLTGFNRVLNLAAKYNKPIEYQAPKSPLVYAHQFQSGFGQEKGGVLCLIYNHNPSDSVPIMYMQLLPWFLRLYVHTLKIENFPIDGGMTVGAVGNTTYPTRMHYVPGRDHQQPYHLELGLSLPPNTITRLSFQFERALLKWTEYPPDANHGFYVSSAVITTPVPPDMLVPKLTKDGKVGSMFDKFGPLSVLQIHTEHLLVSLPTPDFSMPYNVICLACTVVAIAFGSIHNLTTRRFVIQDPKKKGLVGKIKEFLFNLFKSKKSKNTEEVTDKSKSKDNEAESNEEPGT